MPGPLTIGFVAGESSGDQLGAALITALRARLPQLRCLGVCGPAMQAAGCEAWADSHELAVMGLIEPIRHLPRLARLRRMLRRRFLQERPQAFIGIDAPAFNLGLAARLKAAGLTTVQYVSPQVWAWRQGRVHDIGRACDLVLCLYPFEPDFYARHGVRAAFVGHPLADQVPLDPDRAGARAALGLAVTDTVVALLPGSRVGEVQRLGADFLRAAAWVHARRPAVFAAPMAAPAVRRVFEGQRAGIAPALPLTVLDGRAREVLAAADAVLVASGTATLEALLAKRPMVVAYRFSALTAFLARRLGLVKVRYFSLPNLLCEQPLVPEFLQEQVTGAALGSALLGQLEDAAGRTALEQAFRHVHERLRVNGADCAAQAVLGLLQQTGAAGSPGTAPDGGAASRAAAP